MASDIAAAVGENCPNLPGDVRTIQELLNSVPPNEGGPDYGKPLATDGKASPELVMALHKFQSKQSNLGGEWNKVPPGGLTMAKLNWFCPLKALTLESHLQCPHGGQVKIVTTGKPVSPSYDISINSKSQAQIAGCPMMVGNMPSPCTSVRWFPNGASNFLDARSNGQCIAMNGAPQGPVLIIRA